MQATGTMTSSEIGSPAPDFTLQGTGPDGPRPYTLSEERGHPVVLAFYPGDDTPVCTRQLCSYQDSLSQFSELDAVVWGISNQDLASHERFAAKRGLTFPLLADPDQRVLHLYGVRVPLRTKRSVFVVDSEGILRWKHVSAIGLTYQDSATLVDVLKRL